ncbi:MAG: aminotransferase class V-fold PLP-dependent enzyme, partial [Polyangiaceae bacterium]|nr:aminotransferase class V-fold PLP-dependent enzyme [Polyangiaceae bacterium]
MKRLLLGPGPSNVPESVLRALAEPTVGHLDPHFLARMEEVKGMLRQVFESKGALAIPISATGSAGMECCLVNLIEPGDRLLVGTNGVFGCRIAEVARRAGAEVVTVDAPWGRALDPDDLRQAARQGPFRALAVVHAETSTGVLQDLTPMRSIADEAGALLLVDAVTSLGGVSVDFDAHGIDAAYSATQKCLSCPPGLAPVAFSARGLERVKSRTRPVQSWYFDLSLLLGYWAGAERVYHHTAPINMLFALHEALRLVLEEGLSARFERHRRNARALCAGVEALGLELAVPAAERLPPLTLVKVPPSIDDKSLRTFLLESEGIE